MAAPLIEKRITERNPDTGEERQVLVGDAVVRAVQAGASVELAAESVGVSKQTVYNWISRGEEWADPPVYTRGKLKGEPKPIPEGERVYVDFLDAFTRARASGKVWHVANIRRQAEDDWRASAFFLERSDPENWARRDKHHVTGDGSFAPAPVDLSKLSKAEVEKLEELLGKAQEEAA